MPGEERAAEENRTPVTMARLVPLGQAGRDFDLEFWDRVGAQGRLEAMWAMVCEAERWKGGGDGEPRLQRSVERLQRSPG